MDQTFRIFIIKIFTFFTQLNQKKAKKCAGNQDAYCLLE